MNTLRHNIPKFIVFSIALTTLSACQSRPPVPKPRHVPQVVLQNSQILEVLPSRGVCHSVKPMQCLLVKPQGSTDAEIFGIGYNDILGFEPKVGIAYKIRAAQEFDKTTNQPTGYWRLEEILSQIH